MRDRINKNNDGENDGAKNKKQPKKDAQFKVKPFQMPKNLLNALTEVSGGGFILFTIDDKGSPAVYNQFDNDMTALSLQRFCQMWANNVNEINEQILMNGMVGIEEDDDELPPPDVLGDEEK